MIPKIIHYCWFGKKEKTELARQCIESWRKYCPDYELKEWNEDNFDVTMNDYIREAYEAKKWAFVTDFVRLYVLYTIGGIYLDTDVELLQNVDCFLENKAFLGYETKDTVSTALIGAASGNEWIKHCMDSYKGKRFYKKNGELNDITNVEIISADIIDFYHVKLNGLKIDLENVIIYPKSFFCPKNILNGKLSLTGNSYAIHHFEGSWLSDEEKEKKRRLEKYRKYLGWWIGLQMAEFSMEYEKKGIKGMIHLFIGKCNKKWR